MLIKIGMFLNILVAALSVHDQNYGWATANALCAIMCMFLHHKSKEQ